MNGSRKVPPNTTAASKRRRKGQTLNAPSIYQKSDSASTKSGPLRPSLPPRHPYHRVPIRRLASVCTDLSTVGKRPPIPFTSNQAKCSRPPIHQDAHGSPGTNDMSFQGLRSSLSGAPTRNDYDSYNQQRDPYNRMGVRSSASSRPFARRRPENI